MKKIKEFLESKSKVLLVCAIISFGLLIFSSIVINEYSKFIESIIESYTSTEFEAENSSTFFLEFFVKNVEENKNLDVNSNDLLLNNLIVTDYYNLFIEYIIITIIMIILLSIFNLIGYLFKKKEFIVISLCLSIILLFLISVIGINGILILVAWIILNILGLIEQYILEKK